VNAIIKNVELNVGINARGIGVSPEFHVAINVYVIS
jgi:hypothetical protein